MIAKKFTLEIGSQNLEIEISNLAEQANGAVLARYGDTMVLATAVMAKKPREGIDYFPLLVDYEERFYAKGKIFGSRYMRREGRASENAVLSARLIDRSLRPLFNQKARNDVQIIVTILSIDDKNDPDVLGCLAASLALSISDIPWAGPIASVRVGQVNNEFIINPTYQDREKSLFDLVISGTEEKINMIEAGAKETPEEIIVSAAEFGQKYLGDLIKFQKEIIKQFNPEKLQLDIKAIDPNLVKEVKSFLEDKIKFDNLSKLKEDLIFYFKEKEFDVKQGIEIFDEEISRVLHENILQKEKRPDGRRLDEVREIETQVSFLPRTHGSGLFIRGATQTLSILTLGAPGDELLIQGMKIQGKKRFMHHYNFPPYSVGEISPMRGPGRREIGHGALAEKALEPIIPNQEEFPYTMRIVSENLSSNGSTSMASVCGSSLALMDAGVPIKKAAAGIAVGLITGAEGKYKILTDIQGPEDHHGDMDLKAAGTKDGLTAIQMDVKIEGITAKMLLEILNQSKKARLEILEKIAETIKEPRPSLSPFAPRVLTVQIDPKKIGEVIGPQGKIINEIIAQTGAAIDIEDTGLIFITAENEEGARKAIDWIKNLTREVKAGEVFQGKVTRILDFGAFVEILPKQEGLVHISELAPQHVKKVGDVVKVGQSVKVMVKNIDDLGRINLSMKDVKDD